VIMERVLSPDAPGDFARCAMASVVRDGLTVDFFCEDAAVVAEVEAALEGA
jgi:Ethanolamine utilization protein EutJ (predicted chaperonin)